MDDRMSTCEGCGVQPDEIVVFDNGSPLIATACPECAALIKELQPSDPRRIAMMNRINDFKSEWPLKAEMNFLAWVSTLIQKDKQRALDLLVEWHRTKDQRPRLV